MQRTYQLTAGRPRLNTIQSACFISFSFTYSVQYLSCLVWWNSTHSHLVESTQLGAYLPGSGHRLDRRYINLKSWNQRLLVQEILPFCMTILTLTGQGDHVTGAEPCNDNKLAFLLRGYIDNLTTDDEIFAYALLCTDQILTLHILVTIVWAHTRLGFGFTSTPRQFSNVNVWKFHSCK